MKLTGAGMAGGAMLGASGLSFECAWRPGRESLLFTRPYPESIPTLCARRAICTGTRTWPFEDWHPARGDNIGLWGWQPIPNHQTTLAEILQRNGYGT